MKNNIHMKVNKIMAEQKQYTKEQISEMLSEKFDKHFIDHGFILPYGWIDADFDSVLESVIEIIEEVSEIKIK